MGEVTNLASGGVLDITDGRGYKPRSGGVGLVPSEMSTYFRAVL